MSVVRRRLTAFDVLVYTLLTGFFVLVFYPFYNSVLVSITSEAEYLRNPFMLIPRSITFDSYETVLGSRRILYGYRTTLFIVAVGVPISVLLSSCLAYATSRKNSFPGRSVLLYLILITLLFEGGMVPLYMTVRNLGLVGSIWSLILPLAINTFYLIILRSYFNELPDSLIESAKLDGGNDVVVLFMIVLPVSKPVLATVTLFYLVERWNEWFMGMLFIRDITKQPLQLALRHVLQNLTSLDPQRMSGSEVSLIFSDGVRMATIVVVMVPIMMVYPFLQKHFTKGFLLGSIKG